MEAGPRACSLSLSPINRFLYDFASFPVEKPAANGESLYFWLLLWIT